MSKNNLKDVLKKAIQISGYPLEQRVAHLLQKKGWIHFHSVNYNEPSTGKLRELDILAYKIINERRIEIRISCKRSHSKPWILFTEDSSSYIEFGSMLKITPVSSVRENFLKIVEVLSDLLFFSHNRRTINFASYSGKNFSNEARSLIKDGLYSALNSVYHRIFPFNLLRDQRGTVCFFTTVFDGLLFESYYDAESDEDIIKEIKYGQWDSRLDLYFENEFIMDSKGAMVKTSDVLHWFSDRFRVEIITWPFFESYLDQIENVFASIEKEDLALLGLPWRDENFPSTVMPSPSF